MGRTEGRGCRGICVKNGAHEWGSFTGDTCAAALSHLRLFRSSLDKNCSKIEEAYETRGKH